MIKIIFKKKLINEAELSFSQKSYDILLDAFKKRTSKLRYAMEYGLKEPIKIPNIKLPLSDILNLKNDKISSGAIGLLVYNINSNPKMMKQMQAFWDKRKNLFDSKYTKKNVENSFLPVDIHITDDQTNHGFISIENKKISFTFSIYAPIEKIIRHELQHLTQIVNSLALVYYKDLINNTNNIQKVSYHDYDEGKQYGMGAAKERTGLLQPDQDIKKRAARAQKDKWYKQYFSDDVEYETLLSDILQDSMAVLTNSNFKYIGGRVALKNADIKEKMLDKNKRYKILKVYAKKNNITPSQALKTINSSKGYYELAFDFAKQLYKNKKLLGGTDSDLYFKYVSKIRIKEFAKDLINNLVLKFKKIEVS